MIEKTVTPIPVNIEDLIKSMFDGALNRTTRQNKRDYVQNIRDLCHEAIMKYDRDTRAPVSRK